MKFHGILVLGLCCLIGCATTYRQDDSSRDPAAASNPVGSGASNTQLPLPLPNQNSTPTQLPLPLPPTAQNPTQQVTYKNNGGTGRDATSIPADQATLALACKQKLAQDMAGKNIDPNELIIAHKAYKLSYNFNYRVSNWVYHEIKKSNLEYSCAKRTDKFKADPFLSQFQIARVTEKDYKGSITGYDRGHMAPSGDFRWNPEADAESFFMTNMSPQSKNLNQRAWNKLEERVRSWACGLGEVKVYTGPVLNNQQFPLLESCVAVPKQFYKIVVAYSNGHYQGIGFIYNQSDDGDPFKERAVSIRSVEQATGIDFFKDQFAPEVQDTFEKQYNINNWISAESSCTRCSRATAATTGADSNNNGN